MAGWAISEACSKAYIKHQPTFFLFVVFFFAFLAKDGKRRRLSGSKVTSRCREEDFRPLLG